MREIKFSEAVLDIKEFSIPVKAKDLINAISGEPLINEELLNKLEMAKRQVISIKDLAKTYESMKPEEMKPILSNLDDGTVIAIYNSMSGRNKKIIFKALNPKRAAEITELLAGNKKED